MLKSYEAIYDQGKIQWLSDPPPDKRFKLVVVVEQPDNAAAEPEPRKRRVPSPRIEDGYGMLVCKQPGERRLSEFDVAQAMREAESQ